MVLVMIAAFETKEMGKLIPLVFLYPVSNWILVHRTYWKKIALLLIIGVILFIIFFHVPLSKFIRGEQFISEVPGWPVLLSSARQSYISHLLDTAKHTYREVIPWYWGVFRWLSLTYPRPVHRVINWTLVLATLGIFYALYQSHFRKTNVPAKNLWFLICTSCMYFMAITTFDYFFTIAHGFSIGVQGRYFFPTIVPHMALILIGVITLISKLSLKNQLIKLLGLAMITLHTYAFYFVSSSYFSYKSLATFFIQASQYKPWFFKSPFLEIYNVMFIASLLLFIVNYMKIYAKD